MLEPPIDMDELLEWARPNKKSKGGLLRWVLLAELGTVATAEDGEFTHEIEASACRAPLEAALRDASEVADSSP